MLPDCMGMPDGDFDISISTEQNADPKGPDGTSCSHKKTCKHGQKICKHCTHCKDHDQIDGSIGDDGNLYLGGQEILPGTPIHHVFRTCVAAF